MLFIDAIKEVSESEWLQETTRSQLSPSPRKLVSFPKTGSQLKVTALSWKANNSENLLEDLSRKEKVMMRKNVLETLKTSSK